jgi:hypothetical protein
MAEVTAEQVPSLLIYRPVLDFKPESIQVIRDLIAEESGEDIAASIKFNLPDDELRIQPIGTGELRKFYHDIGVPFDDEERHNLGVYLDDNILECADKAFESATFPASVYGIGKKRERLFVTLGAGSNKPSLDRLMLQKLIHRCKEVPDDEGTIRQLWSDYEFNTRLVLGWFKNLNADRKLIAVDAALDTAYKQDLVPASFTAGGFVIEDKEVN